MSAEDKEALSEVFQTLYPIFKLEVYRRRWNMMLLARRGSLAFYVLTLLSLTALPALHLGLSARLILSGGALLVAMLWVGQIQQERLRHREAKSALLILEKNARLFTRGAFIPGESLYPPEWEITRRRDWGLVLDLCVLIILAIVSILTILTA